MRTWMWAGAVALAVASRAPAQESGTGDPEAAGAAGAARQQAGATGRTAADAAREAGSTGRQQVGSLADRCVALMRGQLDPSQRADVGPRCEDLVRAGAERGAASAAPGQGRGDVQPGEAVRAAFTNAAGELTGHKRAGLGQTSRGDVRNTLVSNPLGWFSGLGVNAEYERPFEQADRFSWIAAARYARANATNGNITTFGLGAGADLFLYGRNNEGIRIGPRLELALGSENVQGSTTFARLGLSGEIGYDFIASSGLTAEVAGGLGGRLAGDAKNDENFASFTGGSLGPYLKLGVGFSW